MTYRIKKIKGEPSGWNAIPIDKRVSQWNAEREAHINAQHIEARAYPPKVTTKDDTVPRLWEIYNCTTCTHAEPEHPAHKIQYGDQFHVKCKPSCPMMGSVFSAKWSDGPRFEEIGCKHWDRRIKAPKHGFMPITESGPYSPEQRI